jgi:sugar phosphate isomerase/epimerase
MNDQRENQPSKREAVDRRTFLKSAGVAAAGSIIVPARAALSAPHIRRFGDVRIGAISYSYRALPSSAQEILGYLIQGGLSTVELMGGPAEAYAGIPEGPREPARDASEAERAEFQGARAKFLEEARAWRLSATMDRFSDLGRMYAGVAIDILKLGDPRWSDAEIDYAYRAARAVGARGISFEAGDQSAQRMAPFAAKHALYNGMHNHTQVGDPDWSFDRLLAHSPYNALNLDIGHYVAGTGQSPIPVIQKYHDRITHLHLKDRRSPSNGGDNVPWGEGETPIAEVLRLIQREGYPITAMIELEYPVPETSNVLIEVAKCAGYCRGALS